LQRLEPVWLFPSTEDALGRQPETQSEADISHFHRKENVFASISSDGKQIEIADNGNLLPAAGSEGRGAATEEGSYLVNVARVRSLMSIA
jgi:hypothetical protein